MSEVCGGGKDVIRHPPDETKQLPGQQRHFAALLSGPAGLAGFALHISPAGAFGELTIDALCKSRAPWQAITYA
jgi:hypothetical protein